MTHLKVGEKRSVVLEQLAGNIWRITGESGSNHFIVGEMKKVGYVVHDVFIEPDERGVWPKVVLFKKENGQVTVVTAPGGSDYI